VRPIEEEPGQYELIAGERRWRAARRAGLQTMPVLVQTETTDAHSLEQALVENLHREDLNPLEEAGAYQQLIDEFGFTHDQVAARVGKGRTTVTNTLRLLQLPAGAQRALADGSISAGHARALLGTPDRSLQEIMVRRIMTEGLTVRAVEDMLRGDEDLTTPEGAPAAAGTGTTTSTTATAPVRTLPEPGVLELEELLAEHLDTRVKVEMRNRRGRVVVEFATLEDLERIYRAMLGERPRSVAEPEDRAAAEGEPASPA
jgi:ParB family chromosome partitioning protein